MELLTLLEHNDCPCRDPLPEELDITATVCLQGVHYLGITIFILWQSETDYN